MPEAHPVTEPGASVATPTGAAPETPGDRAVRERSPG